MNQLKLSTANLVILIAGAVMLIASFLDFTKAKATVTFGDITIVRELERGVAGD